jgi:Ulp1 family protease
MVDQYIQGMVYAALPGQRQNHQCPVFVVKTIEITIFSVKLNIIFISPNYFYLNLQEKILTGRILFIGFSI